MFWKRTQEKGIHSVRSQSEKNNKTDKLLSDIIISLFYHSFSYLERFLCE